MNYQEQNTESRKPTADSRYAIGSATLVFSFADW